MSLRMRARFRVLVRLLREISAMVSMLGVLAPRVLKLLRERAGAGLLLSYGAVVLLLTLAPLGVGFSTGQLVDKMSAGAPPATVEMVAGFLILLVVVQAVVGRVQHFLGETVREQLWFVVMQRAAYGAASLSPRFLAVPENRALVTRVNEHGRWKVTHFADNMTLLALNVVGIVIAWGLIWPLSKWLVVITVVAVCEAFVELAASRADRRLTLRESERWRGFWTVLWAASAEEHTPEHQLTGTARRFGARIRGYGEVLCEKMYRLRRMTLIMRLSVLMVTQCVLCLAVWSVVHQAVSGAISPGELTFLLGGLVSFGGTLSRIAANLHDLCRDGHVVGDFFAMCDAGSGALSEPPRPVGTNGVHPAGFGESCGEAEVAVLQPSPPEILIEDVKFSPNRGRKAAPAEWILKGISMTLRPGGKYVLIGASGSGKTTLTKLLTRLEDPTEGRIMIDGVDLHAIDEVAWRGRVGALAQRFQKPEPFTIREIIGLPNGRPLDAISEDELREATRKAGFLEVFEAKRAKLDQLIGKEFSGGSELSEGEWQRLKLAALFLRNSSVLILDEPTSGLDPKTSSRVMEELFRRDGKTLLLVTHWLRHCPLADRIFVMRKGLIVEDGTHRELMAQDGEYAMLYREQLEEHQVRDEAA